MSKKWQALPIGCHVLIDSQVSGLIVEPLPKSAGQTYVVRTLEKKQFVHENRISVNQKVKIKIQFKY